MTARFSQPSQLSQLSSSGGVATSGRSAHWSTWPVTYPRLEAAQLFISAPLNTLSGMARTAAAVLFTVEVYHFVAHVLVLIGWRNLPRRDLVRTR